jgi:hypothetical protein
VLYDIYNIREADQMHRLILAVTAVGLGVLAASAEARAQGWMDVEHARMNALAGGPTNEYDAWILERYGCLSGTNSPVCHPHAYRAHWYRARRRAHR